MIFIGNFIEEIEKYYISKIFKSYLSYMIKI